jgi:hypothetical protein
MNQVKSKLRTWIRLDGNGNTVPGSCIERPLNVVPRGGNWRQISTSYCCLEQSFILFRNTTASASITTISTADGAINWTGTINNGKYYIFEIPNGYNETFTVTVDSFSGRTATTSVSVQDPASDATIGAVGGLSALTFSFATNTSPGAQFLVILS